MVKEEFLQRDLVREVKQSFIDYAMSVIVSRALPNINDGLKPVHRRILYAMHSLGMLSNSPYKKSARIVGEVIGKYHPHGDTAVYDTIVKMAQSFSLMMPLIEGHGNFGSIDGDSAAAMRYTEARLTKYAELLLKDIKYETVDFVPNYDDSEIEPVLLPSIVPNLLINGSVGIAVALTTSIPPHNLVEICSSVIDVIKNGENNNILTIIKGPDFPTRGKIVNSKEIQKTYETGSGGALIQSNYTVETRKNGNKSIVFTDIPYQVNKSIIVEKIAKLVNEGVLKDISDLRDETSLEGIRIVIDLKRTANVDFIVNNLFTKTDLRSKFRYQFVALDTENNPKTFSLQGALESFITFRKTTIKKKSLYLKRGYEKRLSILSGIKKCLSDVDKLIHIIRKSKTSKNASEKIMDHFKINSVQAKAILEMQLQRLTSLEQNRIETEIKELEKSIQEMNKLINDDLTMEEKIISEQEEIIAKFGKERQTKIAEKDFVNTEEIDLVKPREIVLTLTNDGYIKRVDLSKYSSLQRGALGVKAATLPEGRYFKDTLVCNSKDSVYIFTNEGRIYKEFVYKFPDLEKTSKGIYIRNIMTKIKPTETIQTIKLVPRVDAEKYDLVLITKKGLAKKMKLSLFKNILSSGINAITIKEGDELSKSLLVEKDNFIFISSAKGYAIKVKAGQFRYSGRQAVGRTAIKFRKGDCLSDAIDFSKSADLIFITENGYGKITTDSVYKENRLSNMGVKTYKITPKTGNLTFCNTIKSNEEILITTKLGKAVRIKTEKIRSKGRNTQGVILARIKDGDKVINAHVISEDGINE